MGEARWQYIVKPRSFVPRKLSIFLTGLWRGLQLRRLLQLKPSNMLSDILTNPNFEPAILHIYIESTVFNKRSSSWKPGLTLDMFCEFQLVPPFEEKNLEPKRHLCGRSLECLQTTRKLLEKCTSEGIFLCGSLFTLRKVLGRKDEIPNAHERAPKSPPHVPFLA